MEKRVAKVSIRRCGGNASDGANKYGVNLPTKWMKEMGVSAESRDVELLFDGANIAITRPPIKEEGK